jgi:hypothetical protein
MSLFALQPTPGWAQKILDELEAQDKGAAKDEHRQHGPSPHAGHRASKKSGPAHQAHKEAAGHSGHRSSSQTAPGQHRAHGTPGSQQHSGHAMRGFLGPYPMQREGSGTSWLPDTTPHAGIHATYGEWQTMFHALFNLVYDRQGGRRGDNMTFVSGMVMGMAQPIFVSSCVTKYEMDEGQPSQSNLNLTELLSSNSTSRRCARTAGGRRCILYLQLELEQIDSTLIDADQGHHIRETTKMEPYSKKQITLNQMKTQQIALNQFKAVNHIEWTILKEIYPCLT